jgi:hypothetical protein
MPLKNTKKNEYVIFSDALKKVLRVSHSEMKTKLEEEKKHKVKRKRKT